jgi:DUF4097 and DUF4098 domain-containing protein YvlB
LFSTYDKLNTMKQILVLLLVTNLSFSLLAQDHNTPFLTKSLAGAAIEKVEAETSGGNISVTGDASEAKIEVYIRSSNGKINNLSKEEIQKKLDEDYEFSISTAGHTLTAIAKPKDRSGKWNWNKGLSISFKIFVPKNVSTNLTTSGGNLSLAHLSGTQDFRTSGGNLHLEDLTGKIKGITSGGNIHLTDSKDDITLTTSGGNVEASNCQGKIKLTTSGGNLKLDALSGDIDATTSGGTVRANTISGDLSAGTSGGNVILDNMSCTLSASTSGGNIQVVMKELGSYVKLTNSGGNVSLEIPGDKGVDLKLSGDRLSMSTPVAFTGKQEKERIEGTLNGGGIPITVRGSSGRVSLTVRK